MSGRASAAGNITEYAILLAIIAGLGLSSLNLLGPAVSDLLGWNVAQSIGNAQSMMAFGGKFPPGFNPKTGAYTSYGTPTGLKGGGYYSLKAGAGTMGQPTLQLVDSAGTVKNVSSIDGDQFNTVGSFALAQTLEQLAAAEKDPTLKDYYAQMAKLAYYMGANEGELDDVPGFSRGSAYGNGDALIDLMAKQATLRTMMENPPKGFNAVVVQPLAVDVFNIAQGYVNQLSSFIAPDGTVPANFGVCSQYVNGACTFSNTAGGTFSATLIPGKVDRAIRGVTYESLMSYDNLKGMVDTLLSTQNINSQPVQTTLLDGKQTASYSATN